MNTSAYDAAAGVAAKRNEQLLRLALAALGERSLGEMAGTSSVGLMSERTTSAGLDSTRVAARTSSLWSERTNSVGLDSASVTTRTSAPCGTGLSIDEGSSSDGLTSRATSDVELPLPEIQAPEVHEPRIGIDIGDVLTVSDKRSMWEVRGAIDAVCLIAELFGARNVFLVSRVRLGGNMHTMTKQCLHKPNGLLEQSKIPADNVVYVSCINGLYGKGVAAKRLGLSHFIDNKEDVLQSVFEDKCGNSGEIVERFDGILFHFASGGTGRWRPKPRLSTSPEFKSHYYAVSGWKALLEILRKDALDWC